MVKDLNCQHEEFETHSKVGRLTKGEGGPVENFVFECKVKCKQCGMFFEFIGVPGGSNYSHPCSSFDFTELRAPIRPYSGKVQQTVSYQFDRPEETPSKKIN